MPAYIGAAYWVGCDECKMDSIDANDRKDAKRILKDHNKKFHVGA